MTDNEIIKLLECCKKSQCSKCYYSKECDGYTQVNYALDLITRQQVEIEGLKKSNEMFTDIGKMYSEIKAEAYKEFSEKAKEFMHNKFKALDEYEFEYITERDIDNLLKETVGENNE